MVIKAAGQMPFADMVSAQNLKNNNGKVTVQGKSKTNLSNVLPAVSSTAAAR
jgi:hypothetical protein